MDIRRHISFLIENNPTLYAYIETNGIAFKNVLKSCVFDICESDPRWPALQHFLSNASVSCLAETVYTQQELSQAQWLTLRSVYRCGYPQPTKKWGFEKITYSDRQQCAECGVGLVQKADFQIDKIPKWGARHFMMLNWLEDELFLDQAAKDILSGMHGINFQSVRNKNGSQILSDVYQLHINTVLPAGLVENTTAIRSVKVCSTCGRKSYLSSGIGPLVFHKEIFCNMPDVVKTSEFFGEVNLPQQMIIVSQSFYKTVISNRIGKNLVFEPVHLV